MMLRVYSGDQKGATAFFRNRVLLKTIGELLSGECPKVLFHAGSIGAEAYSFAIWCQMHGIECECIRATDLNSEFLAFAKKGFYPATIVGSMSEEEKRFFEPVGDGVSPIGLIRNAVSFLPACSFVGAAFEEAYDVVFLMNALTYATPSEQSLTIANIAKYNRRYLLLTAFHPQSIKADLSKHGYVPVATNREAIHNAWGDRLVSNAPPDHSWMLQAYSEIDEYEYKYCAIFRKE